MVTVQGVASARIPSALFAVAVFASASLVFLVEPMVARMVLPRLGGATAVWNTSLAFFQAALLAGYGYAHLLQRVRELKAQIAIHLLMLAVAALTLPLRITDVLGAPSSSQPGLWLLGVLAVSVGTPFAVLSATAPLIQTWYARLSAAQEGAPRDPYTLYVASNLGSLIALIAYPVVIEPLLGLHRQAWLWTVGYGLFALLVALLAAFAWGRRGIDFAPSATASPPVTWRERSVWIALSAAASSLLLGVTAHITQDVASAPFVWVVPLALYLLSFVIAFQRRPAIPAGWALILQAAFVPFAAALYSLLQAPWLEQLAVNLGAFFFSALVCHQALSARRPDPARLTDFYLSISLGGVLGGAFNAFLAPLIFNAVWEYPIVLGLACLARPWGRGGLDHWRVGLIATVGLCVAALLSPRVVSFILVAMLLTVAGSCAFLLRSRGAIYAAAVLALGVASYDQLFKGQRETHRSFFGVVQLVRAPAPVFGAVKLMVHGSTLHGAQAERASQRCTATTYYGPGTPIGQVFAAEKAMRPGLNIGTVGLGSGTVAVFTRPTDRLRFFEIDPLVIRLALDPGKLTFVRGCAKGQVSMTLGDARLALNKLPDHSFDLLLVDAFSSDSVPTHLLTVEAIRTYLRVIKPDGVVVLHLSNRNLELEGPAAASVREAGGVALAQNYISPAPSPYVETSEQAIIAGWDQTALQPFRKTGRWQPVPGHARAWTDDYVNVFGALVQRLAHPGWGP